ncbi:hypothetical protein DE146DRAFT_777944 [Phaeosphaeria sp. MPI-PUGE-AT-0046c]|nr:hypothetical protein DE146DRAFT_777944 [Phaeosphaeria sp. MPI-PUGE-AT-0046c]
MKLGTATTVLSALSTTIAHSWLGCTDHENKYILEWMKSKATTHGKDHIIDPLMPWFAYLCHGWPRAKQNPGNWVDETNNYLWDLAANADTHACHPSQRSSEYYLAASDPRLPDHHAPAPMATAAAGSSIKLMFGGNGHSRGANAGGNSNAGRVAVYWAGKPETEFVDVTQLTNETLLQENGFSEESFAFPEDMHVQRPEQGLVDKGNWMTLYM